MSKDYVELLQDENTGEFYEPYATIVCKTEEDFKNMQEALEKQTWISVDDRLPEDDLKDVLVWFEYYRYGEYNRLFQTIGISYTDDGEWSGFVNGQSGWRNLRILAWMPLPKPYIQSEADN